jgi:PAS domain S-box-containing protein
MQAASLPMDEARRLTTLLALGVLDTPAEDSFDVLVEAAARLTDCPTAAIGLIDAQREWFKSIVGWGPEPPSQIPRDHAFCSHVLLGDKSFEVADATKDPRFLDNPLVTGAPHIRFYAGEPLVIDGVKVGALFVVDSRARTLTVEQRRSLRSLARATAELLRGRGRRLLLDEERSRLLDFARASGDWMWETDASLRYTWVSGAFEAITGLPPGSMQGRLIADSPLLDNLGQPALGGLTLHALLRRHRPFTRVITDKMLSRGNLQISRSGVPVFDAQGRFAGYRGTARDVTALISAEVSLRANERRWGLAAEAAGIGIAEVDLSTRRVLFDRRACTNHGLTFPHGIFTLDDWMRSIHADDREKTLALISHAIDTGGTLEDRYRLQRPDGTPVTLEIIAHCTVNAQGQVTGLLGTCRDVTQQVAHEQLRLDKETAERANRAKSEFLSRVSHELRTPLNGVLGFAQLMAMDRANALAPEQSRRLDSVLRAARHLLELINDMLSLARIEREDFPLQRAPLDLRQTIDGCVAMVQPLAEGADVRLLLPPSQPLWAQGDERAVEQVLLNLLSNAIKYNRPGGSVRIALQRDGEHARLSVSDDGEGLTEVQQAQLFQPFNRLGAEQMRVEGTGLGLVIARQLAASMHGELQVESRAGLGSTFTLVLPAAAEPAHADDAPSESVATPPAAQGRRRVLYIEDEPLNVLLVQEVFRAQPQWKLDVATDGQEGLLQLRLAPPDLVLIDMNLPDMNGTELIRTLRADPATRGLHCIALSADAMQSQIDVALAAGFDDYWTKPIHVSQMLASLGQVLNGGRQARGEPVADEAA